MEEFLTKLPRRYSAEALVLMRRLELLKSIATDDSHITHEVLGDVGDLQDFIYHYFKSHDTTLAEFVLKYERYQLDRALEAEQEEDE
jgi:hypothetical protein